MLVGVVVTFAARNPWRFSSPWTFDRFSPAARSRDTAGLGMAIPRRKQRGRRFGAGHRPVQDHGEEQCNLGSRMLVAHDHMSIT